MPLHDLEGWGEPIATWDYSSSVANVDFTNLGGYRELLVWGDEITTDTGGTDAPALRLSNDNGSSFPSSGYETGDSTSTSMTLSSGTAAGQEHGFKLHLVDFNAPRKPMIWGLGVRIGTAVAARWCTRTPGPYNAIRFFNGLGANFTGGSIRVFGRS